MGLFNQRLLFVLPERPASHMPLYTLSALPVKRRPRRDHLLRVTSIIATAVVLFWCLHRRNPHLLNIRANETTLLVALATGATLLAWNLPGRFGRIVLCLVNLGTVEYVLVDDLRFARLIVGFDWKSRWMRCGA